MTINEIAAMFKNIEAVDGRYKLDSAWARYRKERNLLARGQRKHFSLKKKQDMFFWQKGLCAICGEPMDPKEIGNFEVDHLQPVANGGDASRGNLGLSHGVCNREKARRDVIANAKKTGRGILEDVKQRWGSD